MRKELLIGGISMTLATMTLAAPTSATDTTDAVDSVSIGVPISCSMEGTGMNSHTASVPNGTYQADIGTTTLKAYCNDDEGFAIFAVGYTGDEIGGTNSTKLVGTNNSIITGTATSGDTSNWAMKLATDSGATYAITLDNSFGSYSAVPASYTKVAHRDSGTDIGTGATGASLTTTYAAFISKTESADIYNGKVKYTLVHPASEEPLQPQPATAGCINYFANGSNAEGTMGCQSATDNASVTLLASNFSRTGYGFAGWSDSYDYATNPNAHFYGPSETITAPEGTTANGLSLYAVWVKSEGSFQDTSKVASVCNSLTTAPTDGTANLSSVSALTDQRDNETYAIAKLADGNCWMIENLRLESDAEHNSDGTLSQGYGGQFAGLANAEPAWASYATTANSLYSTDGANDTINIGTSYASYRFPRYSNLNTPTNATDRPQNPTSNTATNTTSNAGMYSYGNYYTWAAAIADTTYYEGGDHDTTSICPTGWQIPLGDTSTGNIEQGASDPANRVPGFSYLDRKMGGPGNYQTATEASPRWRKYPVNIVLSGYIGNGSVSYRGNYIYYWSSTAYNSSNAYHLSSSASYVNFGTGGDGRYVGHTVRCVVSGV